MIWLNSVPKSSIHLELSLNVIFVQEKMNMSTFKFQKIEAEADFFFVTGF